MLALMVMISAMTVSTRANATDGLNEDPQPIQAATTSLYGQGVLSPREVRSAIRAGVLVGVEGFPVRMPTVSMVSYVRDGRELLTLERGWQVPMSVVAMPTEMVRRLGGDVLAEVLARGEIALGKTSASLRQAVEGDIVTVLDQSRRRQKFLVGAIVPDVLTSDGDILMSDSSVLNLGAGSVRRVTFVGTRRDGALRKSLNQRGFRIGTTHQMTKSSSRKNPDAPLGLAKTKLLLGEFAYQRTGASGVLVDTRWRSANIVHQVAYRDVKLVHNCHRKVIDAIQDALTEIQDTGLNREIDIQISNSYGGCYSGRFTRQAEKLFGNLSRHAWGMAFDINTTTNARGAVPQLNCDVVRIFRKHGFAWGGNFFVPDGMHFEYVGEPRHKLKYPSRYCPNT
jgi:hypothetical protein